MNASEIISLNDRSETISRLTAVLIYRRHGLQPGDLIEDLGDRETYVLCDVLVCLGY